MAHTHAVIGQRGWVWVGVISTEGDELVIRSGAVLRRWGTTRGLGELTGGPTAETVLDPCGEVRIHRLAVVATIDLGDWPTAP